MIILFGEARSADIFYRCSFNSDVDVVYVEDETRTLYVPGFEYLRAKKEVKEPVVVKKLEDPYALMESLTGAVTIPTRFPYALAEKLAGPITAQREIFPERRTKSEQEIRTIENAQNVARVAIDIVRKTLKACELEEEMAFDGKEAIRSETLKRAVRAELIELGFDCPDLIISSGEQTGLPHHRGSGIIREGPVIVDVFPRSEARLYYGDMTRTFILGENEKAQRMLAAVKKAHEECIALCVPGAKASEIHERALQVLTDAGFATDEEHGFIHALGHGVGLDIHEAPSLSPKSEDVLEEGMVVTIEPGLYYDVGVRWEDIVVVGTEPRVL